MKAPKNKTIDLSLEEGAEYLARCVQVDAPAGLDEVLDRMILGDCFKVLPLLPNSSVNSIVRSQISVTNRSASSSFLLPITVVLIMSVTRWHWRRRTDATHSVGQMSVITSCYLPSQNIITTLL